jgi:hypothetical protein
VKEGVVCWVKEVIWIMLVLQVGQVKYLCVGGIAALLLLLGLNIENSFINELFAADNAGELLVIGVLFSVNIYNKYINTYI